jgi:hypothetical protein
MCVLVNAKPDFENGIFGTHEICQANCPYPEQPEPMPTPAPTRSFNS